MASTLHDHGSPSISVKRQYGHFAENSPKTIVGLQKVNVQLQKDIEKLEKQAQTSVSNIANHQQAMKMSWRRLEHRRKMDSPLQTRAHRDKESPGVSRQKRMVLSSNTKLYVNATPQVYGSDPSPATGANRTGEHDDHVEDHPGIGDTTSQPSLSPATYGSQKLESLRSSPYITSPYIRRTAHTRIAASSLTLPPPGQESGGQGETTIPRINTGELSEGSQEDIDQRPRTKSTSDLKLPQIEPTSQPALVTHTTVMDKSTLLQASQLMGLGSSKGPSRFKDFYSSSRPQTRAVRLKSPPPIALHSRSHEELVAMSNSAEGDGAVTGKDDSELTLAELFEQIRHCRYIRHYRPDGTEVEDYYDPI